ncbi:MAG TPA: alpha/beta fold hydrolase [Luteitalea sp.]|nr:alpha/beta fold hydrolase [Luteitalea sp.]
MRLAGALLLGLTISTGCGWTREPPTRSIEVGTGARSLVLLHGFSSSPQEWMPFTATIRLPAGRRFVFPEGPDAGVNGRGRAWWALDLASHVGSDGLPDLSATRPEGLEPAARSVRALLRDYRRRDGDGGRDVVLGGFSQGAMVSAEIAFRSDERLQALVLLSPTIVDEPSWRDGIAARTGLPVFIAHGRTDRILPFGASSRLARTLADAGLKVTWVPFDGGHEIPAEVVTALNAFLETHAR